ncbi:MAG: MBL fold metallo-hydrolase [Bacteriovoracaceae bacterium]|nr:MBL fold metallo-hydrolase [Bacteriovoracaceae bacterium]
MKHFFDPDTFTLTYVVIDKQTKDAVIIDPVLDFDQASGTIDDHSLQDLINYIKIENLNILGVLETHAHADHLSSSQLLKQLYPKAKIAIGSRITEVQDTFKQHFHIDYLKTDGSQFDLLIKDFEEIQFGSLKMKAIPTPGHTPACMSYLFDDALFVGDSVFMPDYGTGRCDFPKGSAKNLYHSITKNLYTLPDSTKVYVGHDYSPNGRPMAFLTTIGESKKNNIQLKANTSENEFISFRESRDKTLKAPRLLLPSIQVNIDAGHLPPKEENGKSYMKLPISLKLNKGSL